MGDLTIISLTDNFATALGTNSVRDYYVGDIAITKTKESHLRESKAKIMRSQSAKELLGGKALEELDVELNLENLNDDLLKQADKIQLTEDELAELERQERDKSVIKDSERDLKSLERLENEIGCELFVRSKKGLKLTQLPSSTFEICNIAFENNIYSYKDIPNEFKTDKMSITAVNEDSNLLKYVPDNHKTQNFYIEIVDKNYKMFKNVSNEFKTESMCLSVLQNSSNDSNSLEYKFISNCLR